SETAARLVRSRPPGSCRASADHRHAPGNARGSTRYRCRHPEQGRSSCERSRGVPVEVIKANADLSGSRPGWLEDLCRAALVLLAPGTVVISSAAAPKRQQPLD